MYTKYFKEAFLRSDVEKAIRLTNKVVSRRIGKKIYMSNLPDTFVKASGGKYAGILCTIDGGRMIRYNWYLSDTSGHIVCIDIWNKIKITPDATIDTEGLNIIKLIDVIVSVLTTHNVENLVFAIEEGNTKESNLFDERKIREDRPITFETDKDIAKSIKQWSVDMGVDDVKLSKERISHLYNDYVYWQHEVATEAFKLASPASFRNYLISYMDKYAIKNIFMRKISVTKSSKEMIYVDQAEKKEFDETMYKMSMQDKMDFLKANILAVLRKHENFLVIIGSPGAGKSKTVRDIIIEEDAKPKWIQGDIKNVDVLYKLFYDNKDKDSLIVFDDVDSLFSKKFLSMTNAAFAPEPKRIISYPTDFKMTLPKGYKDEFIFEGRTIAITNLSKNKIPGSLASRGAVIEIKVDKSDTIDYIRQNIDNVMKEYKQATKEAKLEVLDFIETIKHSINNIDFRLFKRAVTFYLTGDKAWKKYVYVLLKAM